MILPLINVTVIPFLLGALVPVKDHTEWNFGPEYIFQLNKTTMIFMDHYNIHFVYEDVTAMVKCRPSVSSQSALFCHAHNVILSKMTQQMYEDIRENRRHDATFSAQRVTHNTPDRLFKLEFNMQGVQDFKVKGRKLDPHHYDIIPDIIEQFNIGIDLSIEAGSSMKNYEDKTSGIHVISSFMQTNEDTMRASKCNTSLIIAYTPSNQSYEDGEYQDHKNETKSSFHLRLLPISYTNPANKTFSIERTRMACTYQPENIELLNKKWRIDSMIEYFNVMEIRSRKPKFTSRTHLEGYVLFPRTDHKHLFSEYVHLELLRIKPAQYELHTNKYEAIMIETGGINNYTEI